VRIPHALTLVACLTSSTFANAEANATLTKSLHAALSRGPDAVAALAKPRLRIDGITFASDACTSRFGFAPELTKEDLPALLVCLKPLHLVAAGDTLIADPGFVVWPFFEDGKLIGMSGSRYIREDYAAPNLVATANIAPDPDTRAAVASSKVPILAVDIEVCLGADGRVETARVERFNVREASAWADQIIAATNDAPYKPFVLDGTKIRACARQVHVYPAARREAVIAELERRNNAVRMAPALPETVASHMLEGHRIAGEKVIRPDDDTKGKMIASGKDKIIGSIKLCIDTSGTVNRLSILRTTGFEPYDTKLIREMRKWKYTPYLVNGTAAPVCIAVTFIYEIRVQ